MIIRMNPKKSFNRGNRIVMTFQIGDTARPKVPRHFYLKTIFIYLIPVFLICAGHIIIKFNDLEASSSETISGLEQKISVQTAEISKYKDEIKTQQNEIGKFADKMESLEEKLADLYSLEKQLRTIAINETPGDSTPLFGIGGSGEEELPSAETVDIQRLRAHADNLDRASLTLKDAFSDYLKRVEARKKRLASKPSIRPTKGWVTSRFGNRVSPFSGRRELHAGLDIAADKGTPILAAADGVITWAGRKGLLGNLMTIDHGNDIVTRYGHISRFFKNAGQKVKKGEKIALVGNTGRSTGSHLHYEVRVSGAPVDPERFIID